MIEGMNTKEMTKMPDKRINLLLAIVIKILDVPQF
jgi:hypothetical protein